MKQKDSLLYNCRYTNAKHAYFIDIVWKLAVDIKISLLYVDTL